MWPTFFHYAGPTRDIQLDRLLNAARAEVKEEVESLKKTLLWLREQQKEDFARAQAAEAQRDALLAELKNLIRAYVSLLETGRDRIVSAGGNCDPVDVMEAGDPNLIAARAAIDRAKQAHDGKGSEA
jgi:hypothetical protein